MKRQLILLWVVFLSFSMCVDAAELKNEVARQEGNRLVITYDLAGKEKEADVTLTLTVEGKTYKSSELHVEGDIGKVQTGRGKKISWNILQDFPRGLCAGVDWELTTKGDAIVDETTGMEMIFVQGGCFQMGDTFGDGESDEKPVHKVCVHDFYLGKYEVTQGQWKAVMGNNPSNFSNCGDNCPVEQVSWNDVQQFIRKLNSQSGKNFRLPTEAEWEYAARSGEKNEKWAGTNSESALGDYYAWYGENSGSKTHPVGQKRPNGLGLYDVSGNVWEWVEDWKGDYPTGHVTDPKGPARGAYRVRRGGSWASETRVCRSAYRYSRIPGGRNNDLGFRLAVPVQ